LWTAGSKIPLDFISVSEHYVFDEKLIVRAYMSINSLIIALPGGTFSFIIESTPNFDRGFFDNCFPCLRK